jgi:archaellum component FlaC
MASPVQMAKRQAKQMADIQSSLEALTRAVNDLSVAVAEIRTNVAPVEVAPKTTTRKRTAKS